MNDDLDRSLTALMEHAAAPAESARVNDARRQSLEGLARARRRAHRRRITSLVGTVVLVAGVAAFLVLALPKGDPSEPSGTTTSTTQRLPEPTRPEAPNRPGRWWLYPDRSRVGQAAAAAVGRPAKWVQATRERVRGVLVGTDAASLRDERKDGWELDWYAAFARYEFTSPSTPTAGGEYWTGSQDGTIRSVYFVSDDGIGVWAGHFSPSPEVEPVPDGAPLEMAKRFVAELRRRGDFRSTPLNAPVLPSGGALIGARLVSVAAIPSQVGLRPAVPATIPVARALAWRVTILNTGDTTLQNVVVKATYRQPAVRRPAGSEVVATATVRRIDPGATVSVTVPGPPADTYALGSAGVLRVEVRSVSGERNIGDNVARYPVTIAFG